jgi:hypothetical protein
MKSGEQTGEFGYWLDNHFKNNTPEYEVYYDHGNSDLENVGAIQGFIGYQPKRFNILAEVDVMVVEKQGNIILLIEIEDKSQPSPKKLLGVLFSIVLCNQFAFGVGQDKRVFNVTPETKLILAGFINPKGRKREQIFDVIQPRLNEIDNLDVSVSLNQVSFVFEKDLATSLKVLKEGVGSILYS